MTRAEAAGLVSRLLASLGVKSPGLNAKGFGGAALGEVELYFEHRADGTLRASALVYRFRKAPKPRILEGFRQLGRSRALDSGGGMVDFQPDNGGLYLTRSYPGQVTQEAFTDDLRRLGKACMKWRTEGVERVISRVSGF